MSKKPKQTDIICDIEAKALQTKIENLIKQMNPGNFLDLQNQVAALQIKLRARRPVVDFTMNHRHDWGVRVVTFQTT